VLAGNGFRLQRDASRARIELLERSRKLEQEIVGISERERQNIGRDLHDDLGQYLVAIGFAADALKKRLEKGGSDEVRAAGQIADQLNQAVIRTRNFARGISPVDQGEGSLELALEQLVYSASLLSGISCSFICDGNIALRDNTQAVHLYRMAQEALNNAMKHGHAQNIIIALEADEESLSLRISDDGTGFDPGKLETKGMGLSTMRYRAQIIGGVLEIHPNPPHGTVVSCTIDTAGTALVRQLSRMELKQ
jgi:signal transduction histidine kinase